MWNLSNTKWPVCQLSELLTESSKRNKNDNNFPVYSVTNEAGFTRGYFSKDVFSKNLRNYKIVEKKDFAYNPSRINVGSIDYFQHDGMGLISPLYVTFRVSEKLEMKFLKYYLKSPFGNVQIRDQTSGSVRDSLSYKGLCKISIPLPTPEEQKRIVSLLDQADALRRKRKESMRLLDEYVESVFLEMFGDPLTNPKEWEIKKMNDICDVRDGTHDSPKYHETGYPLVTSKNVKDGFIDFSTAKLISKQDFDDVSRRSAVDDGDIIMPMIGTMGNPVIVVKDREFAIKNVALIKFTRSSVLNSYIQFLLGDRYLSHQIKKKSKGGTQKFLSLSDIRSLEIPVPTLDLQEQFAAVYRAKKKIEGTMKIQDKEIDNQFNALMQKAFAGTV